MTNNLHDKLNEEINNDYKPYTTNSTRKECSAFVIEGAGDKSYHLYYHRLDNRMIQRFKDFETGKEVIVFDLRSSGRDLVLFLVNFSDEFYTKFEEDFLNRHVQRIFEYSGDFEKASKPVIMVKESHEVGHGSETLKVNFINKSIHKHP